MNYQWTITVDHTGGQAAGTVGPHDATMTSAEIAQHPDGLAFRMKDADGELYFEGVYLGPADGDLFAPLEDFGSPDAGCTDILYRDAQGGWEFL